MKRDFTKWLSSFRDSIATYSYYVDFEKILEKYPETLKCIPILLAVRNSEIAVSDEKGTFNFDFASQTQKISDYADFMEKSGLFDLLQNHLIGNLID